MSSSQHFALPYTQPTAAFLTTSSSSEMSRQQSGSSAATSDSCETIKLQQNTFSSDKPLYQDDMEPDEDLYDEDALRAQMNDQEWIWESLSQASLATTEQSFCGDGEIITEQQAEELMRRFVELEHRTSAWAKQQGSDTTS